MFRWFSRKRKMKDLREELSETDKDLIRLVDDLTSTFVKAGLIRESDLPVEAREKLERRREIRKKLWETSNEK